MESFNDHNEQTAQCFADGKRLIEAAANGDSEAVLELLDKGVPTMVADSVGLTPLMVASRAGHSDVVRSLLDAGADVNPYCALKEYGTKVTALWFAANYGRTDVVKLLLDAGADPNDWVGNDVGSCTYPLSAACYEGYVEIARLLLVSGAHVNPVNVASGEAPLKVACKRGQAAKKPPENMKKHKQYVEIVNLLLAAGAK